MGKSGRARPYKRILQIIPAGGRHLLLEASTAGGAPRRETKPLAVWALVEADDGAQGIVGYTGGVLTLATGQPHFRGYEHESQRSGRAEQVADVAPIEIDERPL